MTPVEWEARLFGVVFPAAALSMWLVASTVGAHFALIPFVLVAGLVSSRMFAGRTAEQWTWSQLRMVALDGGAWPALQLPEGGLLSLRPWLVHAPRNEPLVWTIAALDTRDRPADATVERSADLLIRELLRDSARSDRPQPGMPQLVKPDASTFVRRRFASNVSLVAAAGVLVAVGSRVASGGDLAALVTLVAIVVILVTVVAVAVVRARRLQVSTSSVGIQRRGVSGMRSWSRERIGALVAVTVSSYGTARSGRTSTIDGILVDREGGLLARFRGTDWTVDELERIAAGAGIPFTATEIEAPARTVNLALPGYTTRFEQHPIPIGLGIVVAFMAGFVAFVALTDGLETPPAKPPPPSATYRRDQADRTALESEFEQLVQATFPRAESEGGSPLGCVRDAAGATAAVSQCRVSPAIRALMMRLAPEGGPDAIQVLCRCRPGEFGISSTGRILDPTAEPGSYAELSPPRTAPRLVGEVRLSTERGPVQIELDMDLDAATGRRTITDVRCANDEDQPGLGALAAARGLQAPDDTVSLACSPEPDFD